MNYRYLLVLAALAFALPAATWAQSRSVDVTVTDPPGRIVVGLDRANFEVVENGVARVINGFSASGTPTAVAIVGGGPLPDLGPLGATDELLQTPSVAIALNKLNASTCPRKMLVIMDDSLMVSVPAGIQVVKAASGAELVRAIIGLRNAYRLEFAASTPSSSFEVLLKPPQGLPQLALKWK